MKVKWMRVISAVLAVVLVVGVVAVSPFASAAYVYNPSITLWGALKEVLVNTFNGFFGTSFDPSSVDFTFSTHGAVSKPQLEQIKKEYNSFIGRLAREIDPRFGQWDLLSTAIIEEDEENNILRLKDTVTDLWIVDSYGRFPYVDLAPSSGDGSHFIQLDVHVNPSPELNKVSGNHWISEQQVLARVENVNPAYSYDNLTAHAQTLNQLLKNQTPKYLFGVRQFGGKGLYGLTRLDPSSSPKTYEWLADSSGNPYLTTKDKNQLAMNQKVNNVVQDGNGNAVVIQGENVTTNQPIIDQSTMELTVPITYDNSVEIGELINQDIYNMTFNTDDRSYTLNTYDVDYSPTTNNYVTNHYTWKITYNITNTYVTYIGSNDAYQQEAYEFYYELPDGRSSADLTPDEVAAMSFQFEDVMNYQRSPTDTNLRALYHFDGDTSDSGYFSDKTAFAWTQGASITYMDSSVFDGALYLDETQHNFDITLPTTIKSGADFTIQFRYYQASQVDTQSNINNYLYLGNTVLCKWDERYLYNSGGSQLGYLPIGSWAELALVRHSGVIYLYVNGLRLTSWANADPFDKHLKLSFGTTSRQYSMVDELRVLDFAIAQSGESYTPTSVPYDSNLVLVLPGDEVVLDEWWEFKSPNNRLCNPDFTVEDYPLTSSFSYSDVEKGQWFWSGTAYASTPNYCSFADGYLSLASQNGVTTTNFQHNGTPAGFFYQLVDYGRKIIPYSGGDYEWRYDYAPGLSSSDWGKTFTFSIVDTSGMVYSHTFTFGASTSSSSFPWGYLEYRYASSGSYYRSALQIAPAKNKGIDIIYAELVEGPTSQVVASKVSSVFDLSTLKPNTAAVQTDIPIHGYTVGGVRPTFPARGDVWFGVTNGRVSTVQVYTGSAWTSTNARWWTGSRWIPIYAFDIYTLEDCWDVADGGDVITPIESDTAGWNWWKAQWKEFRDWLSGSGGGDSPSASPPPSNAVLTEEEHSIVVELVGGLRSVVTGAFGTVFNGVSVFFGNVSEGVDHFFSSFQGDTGVFGYYYYAGDDIWD